MMVKRCDKFHKCHRGGGGGGRGMCVCMQGFIQDFEFREGETPKFGVNRLSSGGYEGDSLLISCLRNFVPLML